MSDDYFKPSLNPDIDIDLAEAAFAFQKRVHIGSVFKNGCATTIQNCLMHDTPWGFAWWDSEATQTMCKQETDTLTHAIADRIARDVQERAKSGGFCFAFHCHPMLPSIEHQERWMTPPLLDDLLAYINGPEVLKLVRDITNYSGICRADAHATHFAPNQFFGSQHVSPSKPRRIAYMMNFTQDWHEDWGGYLQFYSPQGDILQGYKPHFNSLSLCDASLPHGISVVPSHAPYGHIAIRGHFYEASV
jgi:SM-20-related protein